MKRLITIGLSCVLMTGCGEPLVGDVAPSATAPSLDALDEPTGDAQTMDGVEEEGATACPRAPEPEPAEIDVGTVPKKIVVSCGTCTFSVANVELRYALTANGGPGFITDDMQLHMTLASSRNAAGFSASFSGPPSGVMRFRANALKPSIVTAGTGMTLSVCIDGASYPVSISASP
jgi:hypothetical protein